MHNAGLAATNVRLTYYAITPPGVGDNGTWTPLQTKVVPSVPANGTHDEFVNWVPIVGEHTCLKIVAEPQLGEVSVGNNSAQENVFHFQPAAASVPEPIAMPVAVRNPRDVAVTVQLRVFGVPDGYLAYLPYRWVRLAPLGEARMDLLIVPTADLKELRSIMAQVRKRGEGRVDPAARIRVHGQIERGYAEEVDGTGVPGSWFSPIGGISARVEPKRMADIKLAEDRKSADDSRAIGVRGSVRPGLSGQAMRVDLRGSDRSRGSIIATTGAKGVFEARFVLSKLDRPKVKVRGNKKLPVRYEIQAHIFNASELAPTSSNVVRIERG